MEAFIFLSIFGIAESVYYRTNFFIVVIKDVSLSYFSSFFLAGPAVIVGVTMYVLSISSLSEVQMVSRKKEKKTFSNFEKKNYFVGFSSALLPNIFLNEINLQKSFKKIAANQCFSTFFTLQKILCFFSYLHSAFLSGFCELNVKSIYWNSFGKTDWSTESSYMNRRAPGTLGEKHCQKECFTSK